METYDIYLCDVFFLDPDEEGSFLSKKRPVLIIDGTAYLIQVAEITSHEPREWDSGDYAIMDWEEAGLLKPSTVRLNLQLQVAAFMLERRLGRLSIRDIANIDKML